VAEPASKGEAPKPRKGKEPGAEGQPSGSGEPPAETVMAVAPEVLAMAAGCFDRADQAVVRGNLDYAIRLYLDGLRYTPSDAKRGHQGLRDAAIRRRNQGKRGGLGPLINQAKGALYQMIGRPKDAMIALEAAFAYDPQNVMLLSQIMQLARRLEYDDVAIWFGELAAEETLRSKKPQKQVFTTLAKLYEDQRRYQDAVNALSQAIRIDPADRDLDKQARDLSAHASIEEGKLESVGDFHDMIRDKRSASASATQQVVRTREQLDAQYEELRAALDADPENPAKMQALAECQTRRGFADEALSLLKKALALSGEYRYKARMDDFRMADYRQELRDLEAKLEAEPERADLKAQHKELLAKRDVFELEVYAERQKQYPTDMAVRYELGVRQYRSGQQDAAIVSLQTSTRDPKRRILALNMLGRCFFAKELYQEAQSQFEAAIQQYDLTSDPLAKELRYNLAKTFEAEGKAAEAIEWYSVIVQQDYQYRDAAKRLETLRRKASGKDSQA